MPNVKNQVPMFDKDSLATLFVDHIAVSRRNDDLFFISFSAELPKGLIEQVRFMTTKAALSRMRDTCAKALDVIVPQTEKGQNKLPPKKDKS